METIKSSEEISRMFKAGNRVSTPDLTFIVLRNEDQHGQHGRVAFIAGKKLGNAVWRNRAKRRMRGLCNELGGPFPGYDVIFLAKSRINETPYSKLFSQSKKALDRQGIGL